MTTTRTPLTPWASYTTIKTQRAKHAELYATAARVFATAPAEHALLARILRHGKGAYDACVQSGITASSFWCEHRAAAYLLLGEVCALTQDLPTRELVASRAALRPEVDVQTIVTLYDALERDTSQAQLPALIEEVRHVERRRDVQVQLLKAIHSGATADRDVMIAELERVADALRQEVPAEDRAEGSAPALGVMQEILGELQDFASGKRPPLIEWGIAELDALLGGGMAPGNIYHVAAPEKTGKSQLVLALLARLIWERGTSIGIDLFSCELSYKEVMAHMFAWLSRDLTYLTARDEGEQGEKRLQRVPTVTQVLRASPANWEEEAALHHLLQLAQGLADNLGSLRYSQSAGQTVEWLEAEVKRRVAAWRSTHGDEAPYLVVVDYGQDLTTAARVHSEAAAQERVSATLRKIAKQLHITVLVVLHTGGAVDSKPSAHIHGSRQWAKDTSGMIVLWRPLQGRDEPWQYMRAEVVRSRRGQRGVVELYADVSRCWFGPWHGPTPAAVQDLLRAEKR